MITTEKHERCVEMHRYSPAHCWWGLCRDHDDRRIVQRAATRNAKRFAVALVDAPFPLVGRPMKEWPPQARATFRKRILAVTES